MLKEEKGSWRHELHVSHLNQLSLAISKGERLKEKTFLGENKPKLCRIQSVEILSNGNRARIIWSWWWWVFEAQFTQIWVNGASGYLLKGLCERVCVHFYVCVCLWSCVCVCCTSCVLVSVVFGCVYGGVHACASLCVCTHSIYCTSRVLVSVARSRMLFWKAETTARFRFTTHVSSSALGHTESTLPFTNANL